MSETDKLLALETLLCSAYGSLSGAKALVETLIASTDDPILGDTLSFLYRILEPERVEKPLEYVRLRLMERVK